MHSNIYIYMKTCFNHFLESWQVCPWLLCETYAHVDPICLPCEIMCCSLKMACSASGSWLSAFIYLDVIIATYRKLLLMLHLPNPEGRLTQKKGQGEQCFPQLCAPRIIGLDFPHKDWGYSTRWHTGIQTTE